MKEPADQNAILLNRLQEREREQFLILSICKSLSEVTNKQEFHNIIGGLLKEQFLFEDFIFASADDNQTDYEIFYQFSDQKNTEAKTHPVNDGFFDVCLNDADTVVFDLKRISERKNKLPDYLQSVQDKNFKNGIGIGLPYIKGYRNVLFLFFKNTVSFSRESNRIIRGIAIQLSITLRNIKWSEAYESNLKELKHLQYNLSKRKPETKLIGTESFLEIVGSSEVMQKVYELVDQVALSQSTVLILGETGTGKELIANAIHNLSLVSNKRMVKVNCASIPENLIESELFGHEKGAFTGASDLRIGKFEQAEDGTIFLDEIGELPLELQGKLLRVLQEKEIERIGGNNVVKVNARVIAATNKSLEKEVAEGRFRSDLFYRLNVFPIAVPALRERPEDIEVLGNFFLERHSEKNGKKIKGFSKKVLKSMYAHPWPGNVRELENMVERSILFAKDNVIKEMTFPEILVGESLNTENDFYTKTLQEVEKEHILKTLKKCGGRISGPQGAAVLLGLPSTTLVSRMQKLGIKRKYF
ncbi:sigma-54 interaction domain-containing protein [Flavobacterium hungaricum]|uniref:Sigma-54-dependent Fis family transcriptional regulator n=1 Tax=Flavobacterium hungaricum TaxID=2082725 RepID=A0ABR9TSA2_9FLAO|nr:sigma-54 dependent transcriptional regulator [Flavobacterium hungaricum]MBE8728213.1 sigma-54-dependent Fis family transcriptional regulator [Flavobacterium hungaricum]